MSDIIKLLPDSVANQIAAGEVIQRPASVIKELVENAVDAGATDIRIFVKDAGRTLIQVVDNGKGMSVTDARMAFERHATSKIRGADDLFTLHTMGFRGEALPSICAISKVELKTRTEDASIGTRLVIEGSRVETQEPYVCDKGTNIMVKSLFYNVPARRKFLKSDNVELSNVMREFERLALVNNGIRMSIDNGSKVLDLRAGSFKQRIGDIWKNNLDLHLLPIEVETSLIKISGFVSRPEFARRRNPLQYLIVNGRNMRHPYFHKAIMNCYESLIAADTQPCYFLKFEVDPSSIDVNIHPTKNEIKFEYEQEIWPILQASVKAALGKHGAVPSIDFNSDVLPVDPLPPGVLPEKPSLDISPGYNPFAPVERHSSSTVNSRGDYPSKDNMRSAFGGRHPDRQRGAGNWDILFADFMRRSGDNGDKMGNTELNQQISDELSEKEADTALFSSVESGDAVSHFCVQHALRFIITSSREGLIIIDQHRAHLKILYEKFMNRIAEGGRLSQPMMFPETVTLDPEHQAALEEVNGELSQIGFILEYDAGSQWKITSIPALLKDSDPKDVVLKILDSVCEGGENYGKDSRSNNDILSGMALVMARSSAINSGTKLSSDEMEHIVGELFSLPDPAYTPNGNAVYQIIDNRRLEAMFR